MIRLEKGLWVAVALAVTVTLMAPTLVRAQVIRLSERVIEPNLLRIKAELEKQGYKVHDAGFDLKQNPPAWFAVTAANYAAPTWGDVMEQAVNTWVVINGVIGRTPATLWADEVWTKYIIQISQSNEKVGAFVAAWNAAKTDDDRRKALNIILGRFGVKVFDSERGRYVDAKDFVNKTFTD